MAKNAKSCPAAIGTEELVAYLHTLLQENSHNMHAELVERRKQRRDVACQVST